MAVTSVNSAAASTALIAVNGLRKKLIICNDDANRLHVLLSDGTATTSNYSFSLAQHENACIEGYTGAVVGIWAADGAGAAKMTEY